MEAAINIFHYEDYRVLLVDLIERRKQSGKTFSYRWFSQKAGLQAPNFLHLVVKGKRHLSSESLEKVIEVFQLKKDEAEFFRHLVAFNKSKTPSEKEQHALRLIKLRKFQKEFPLSRDQFEYYSQWHHIPVREILNLKEPPRSEREISETLVPSVPAGEIRAALEKLHKLEMIAPSEEGWKVANESVTTGHTFSSFGVVEFHKKMMTLAAEALDRFPREEREISSVTVGFSEATFAKIKTMIERFRSELMALAEADQEKERLYQINFQLFPLTQKRGSRK